MKARLPLLILLIASTGAAQELALTLDEYTRRAIEQGIRGRQTALSFETAGYSRRIAFRQTDSPRVSVGYTQSRSETETETDTDSFITQSKSKETNVTLSQPLPTGTEISAVARYGDTSKPGLSAQVTQPLYLFVRNPVLRGRRRARLDYESAEDSYESSIRSIRTQARSLYYEVMLREEAIKVEQRKTNSSKTLMDVTVALVDAGRLAPVEAMRSKIRTQRDQRQLQNAIVERDRAVLNAKNFIFLPLETPTRFLTQLQFEPFNFSLERLTEYAYLHRPELRSLRRSQELAQLSYEASKEPTRPTLSLASSYGMTDHTTLTKTWTLSGTANWLFFDSFVTRDQARIAKIGVEVADLNVAEAERSVRLEVANVYRDVKNAERQISDFQASREQARRNVDVLRTRFQNGLERLIDVFDAENEARNLEFEYLNLLINFNRTKDNVAQLIGGELDQVR